MTRPEKVSPPPNFCAYTLDDGTIMKKDIWGSRKTSTRYAGLVRVWHYLHECVCDEHYDKRAHLREPKF